MISPREALLAKLAQARAVLANLERQERSKSATKEWQKGYVRALEEVLDLEGFSLRRDPRRATSIPTEITRTLLEQGTAGQRREGTIMDLSVGGCRLYTTAMELSEGEIIGLTFTLPGGSTIVSLRGSVRRVNRINGALGAGVEFMNPAEDIVADLQAFLALPLS